MRRFNDFNVGTRLTIAFGLVLSLMLATAGIGASRIDRIHDELNYYSENTTPSLTAVHEWTSALDEVRLAQAEHVMANSDAEMSAIEARVARSSDDLRQSLADYEKLLSNDEDKRLWEGVKAATENYLAGWDGLKAVSRQTVDDPSQTAVARRLFVQSAARYAAADAAIDKEWSFNAGLGAGLVVDADKTFRWALILLAAGCGAALLVGGLAAAKVTGSITGPVRRAVNVAQAVASGDLSSEIVATSADEIGQLLTALKVMNESLVEIVGTVRVSSDSIATGSSQIAVGNADLSQRTEEQASNLEQTAASMEQLTATVKTNADTVRQATQLAGSASAVAMKGGLVVAEVVATMQSITASSNRIADIIGVIDGIAFQTNILALNAAVEAARAGEQGRGFAVVASEVRSLAQRSASAAKEIKALISESVDKVEAGSAQVGEAGRTMNDIVAQVHRVNDLITEIGAATQEQAQGIDQVGDAVNQLDQVTQQNAALVEESSAAAESLSQQAAKLVKAVSLFKMGSPRAP